MVVLERKENDNRQDVEKIMIGSGCYCTPEFVLFIYETQ